MNKAKKRIRGRLTYANVMVSLLALVVLGGGGAYALAPAPGAQPADLSVSISGPSSEVTTAGGPPVHWHETVSVRNRGPGKTRPVVFVGAPGKSVTNYNQAGDNDQVTVIGTVLDVQHSASTCIPLGPENDVQGVPSHTGSLVCEGPMLASGQSASFFVAYISYPCAGGYTLVTRALVTSALLDPDAGNDRAGKAVGITNTGGCG